MKKKSPDEVVTVQLDVNASGFVKTQMTRVRFEEVFADGGGTVPLEDVLSDMSNVVNDLDFEITDAVIVEPKSPSPGKGKR